jgi:hypothetical protein
MKEARVNPGKWTDWDHAYDAFQKYLDHADRILDIPPEKRSRQWGDAITDHFVINYHRVIGKDEWKELKFTELRKQLNDLRDKYPGLSEAPIIAEDQSIRRKSHVHMECPGCCTRSNPVARPIGWTWLCGWFPRKTRLLRA